MLPHLWWEKRATSQTSLGQFLKRTHRTESSKEPGAVPPISSISETENCPPSAIADNPSALWFPTFSLHSSHSSCLFSQCQPLYASYYTILLYFSRYCTVRLKMFIFVFLFYVLSEKYYKPISMLMLNSSVVSNSLRPFVL